LLQKHYILAHVWYRKSEMLWSLVTVALCYSNQWHSNICWCKVGRSLGLQSALNCNIFAGKMLNDHYIIQISSLGN